jgi:hypothetical protein
MLLATGVVDSSQMQKGSAVQAAAAFCAQFIPARRVLRTFSHVLCTLRSAFGERGAGCISSSVMLCYRIGTWFRFSPRQHYCGWVAVTAGTIDLVDLGPDTDVDALVDDLTVRE